MNSRVIQTEAKLEQAEIEEDSMRDKLKYLRALIAQSRHKGNTVKVSLGPDHTGTCFRLFKWPIIASSTSIRFNFAATRFSDSLLFFWPSSIAVSEKKYCFLASFYFFLHACSVLLLQEDYIAIEMINSYIKASWDLGSGVQTLIHPFNLQTSENSNDPDHWVKIIFER